MEVIQDLQPVENIVFKAYESPLHALRRTQLWRLCDLHGVAYPEGASKEVMLRIVQYKKDTGEFDPLQPPAGLDGDTYWKVINGPIREYEVMRAGQKPNQTNQETRNPIAPRKDGIRTRAA